MVDFHENINPHDQDDGVFDALLKTPEYWKRNCVHNDIRKYKQKLLPKISSLNFITQFEAFGEVVGVGIQARGFIPKSIIEMPLSNFEALLFIKA